jgi:hypothetical protein
MHMPSSTSPSSHPHTTTGRQGARETHAKAGRSSDQENVQRFRTLMDGKQRQPDDAGQSAPDEESSVDLSADANGDTDASANDNELSPDQEQSLRDLLQRQLSLGGGRTSGLAPRDQQDDTGSSSDQQDDRRDDGQAANIGMQVLHMAQQTIVQNAEQPTAASQASMAPALAELIERHVKQLLVPDATSHSSAQAREIMITLKDGLLPGTELWLSRTGDGWKLRADTRSGTAYRSLVESTPQLIERFAQSRLGSLEVTATLLT